MAAEAVQTVGAADSGGGVAEDAAYTAALTVAAPATALAMYSYQA